MQRSQEEHPTSSQRCEPCPLTYTACSEADAVTLLTGSPCAAYKQARGGFPLVHGLTDGLWCYSKVVRKSIARVLTVISQSQRTALRNAYSNKVPSSRWAISVAVLLWAALFCACVLQPSACPGLRGSCGAPLMVADSVSCSTLQKYLPLDLRPKYTRAIRRRLTKHQVGTVCRVCGGCVAG